MPPFLALVATLLAAHSEPVEVALQLQAAPQASLSDAEQARLRAWLIERLAEEGFVVTLGEPRQEPAPDTTTRLQLRIRLERTHWQVVAQGAAEHSESVASGSFEVTALELLHKATSALERARVQPVTANKPPTTEQPAPPAGKKSSAPGAKPSSHDTRKATALATVHPRTAAPERDPDATPVSRAPFADWRWGLEGSAGWQQRGLAGDPQIDLRLATVNPSGLGVRLQLSLNWSSLPPALNIWEFAALLGPTWTAPLSRHWAFVTGVLGGVRTHLYTFEQDTNLRGTWLALIPAEARLKFGTSHIGGGVFAGIAGPPPRHELWGVTAWERSALLWGAMLSAGAGL